MVNLDVATGVFDLTASLANFAGPLRITTNSIRLHRQLRRNGVTLDLGTGSATSSPHGIAAASFSPLQGGPATVLRGASDDDAATTYTVGAKNLATTFAAASRTARAEHPLSPAW